MSGTVITQALLAAVLSLLVILLLDMFIFANTVGWVTVVGIAIGVGVGFVLGGVYRHKREKSKEHS
jgi:positive regulator of sigma E activity